MCFVTLRQWSFSVTTFVTSQGNFVTSQGTVTSQHAQNEKYVLNKFMICFNIKGYVYTQDIYLNHIHPK